MIEIIQQTAKTEDNLESKLPKNIRQIGNPEKDFRIYMEDYVYTYLHPAQITGIEIGVLPRLLILLGEINHFSNRSCAFISGAIQVENRECKEELPELNEAAWRQIHKQMQRFFDKCEIVGWVLDIPGNTLEISAEMEEIHRRNFVSSYQFFFLMDSMEREEAFYTWKDGRLSRKEGYFIYYEKNPQMQEYMISRRESLSGEKSPTEEGGDQAAKNYRAMMLEKKERSEKGRTGILSYLTSILTVIALCAVSVILLGSIHRMENMEQTISVMSTAIEEAADGESEKTDHQVAVETVSGTILPETDPAGEQKQEEAFGAPAEPETPVSEGTPVQEETPVQAEEPQADPAGEIENDAPAAEEEKPDAQPAEPAAADEISPYLAQGYYIVQKGDNLQKICYTVYKTQKMLRAVCEANQIEDQDTIYAGQKIILPTP